MYPMAISSCGPKCEDLSYIFMTHLSMTMIGSTKVYRYFYASSTLSALTIFLFLLPSSKKADDNTFAIIENMRFMLAAHNPNDPIHFGYKQKILLYPEAAGAYFVLFFQRRVSSDEYLYHLTMLITEFGGTGYVLSNKAVRLLTEKFLRKNKTCSNLERMEDWNISLCLYKAGCIHGVGRDEIERERFVPESVITHFFTTRSMSGRFYKDDEGLDYVSNYAVSFHEILPQQLYSMYYLIHYLKVFGIQHRYPPLPRALSFSEEKFLWKQEQSKYF